MNLVARKSGYALGDIAQPLPTAMETARYSDQVADDLCVKKISNKNACPDRGRDKRNKIIGLFFRTVAGGRNLAVY